ncbi:hypothetical protein B447_13709 [Thauera sp. 27]|uniref:hypothetical protein n=1 Tax=Thauera sp. 27 TaxID=305700 RepID=UPI0002CE27D6|nr:hypothetical protein [Thauera sp. 27]ENO79037.1 hypothetical protein B447_13709 [Thauera sp. 27]
MNERLQKLLLDTKSAFKPPALKQKEAYGRLALTMSTASLIGSVTVMFSEPSLTVSVGSRVGALVFWDVLLF